MAVLGLRSPHLWVNLTPKHGPRPLSWSAWYTISNYKMPPKLSRLWPIHQPLASPFILSPAPLTCYACFHSGPTAAPFPWNITHILPLPAINHRVDSQCPENKLNSAQLPTHPYLSRHLPTSLTSSSYRTPSLSHTPATWQRLSLTTWTEADMLPEGHHLPFTLCHFTLYYFLWGLDTVWSSYLFICLLFFCLIHESEHPDNKDLNWPISICLAPSMGC